MTPLSEIMIHSNVVVDHGLWTAQRHIRTGDTGR